MLLLLLTACSDTGLNPVKDETPGFDSGDVAPDDTAAPPEACNGIDDDGDGVVDEGFPDDDANGRADCVDLQCPALFLGAAGPVSAEGDCEAPGPGVVTDPWAARLKWQVVAPSVDSDATNVVNTPAVGNLDDDNGDGIIGVGDVPDVVATFYDWPDMRGIWIAAFDGATGTEKWVYGPDAYFSADVVIADLDGDGAPEVQALSSGSVIALNGDGTVKWEVDDIDATDRFQQIADINGDGIAEIVSANGVLDGATGAVRFKIDLGPGAYCWGGAVGDIDQDHVDQELLFGGKVFDSDGTLLWDSHELSQYGVTPAIVQADEDDAAEIAWIGYDLTIWEDDGTLRTRVDLEGYKPGPPCAGDLDGDGDMEIAWPDGLEMYAYELDGTPMWTARIDDSSGMAGCTVWDMDGDGAAEVIFGGQDALFVFDGATGTRHFTWGPHASGTIAEVPALADLDGDGHGEIIAGSQSWKGGTAALYAIEQDGDGWAPSGPLWASRDYSATDFDDDGGVPPDPAAPWLAAHVFRGRGSIPQAGPNLVVAITDVCVADCVYGPVAVALQVANPGAVDVAAGAVVTLYADDGDTRRMVATATLPVVPAGQALAGIELDLAVGDVGTHGFRAVVDDSSAVAECHEDDNEGVWNATTCP